MEKTIYDFSDLDALLASADLSNVTADSASAGHPDGFYVGYITNAYLSKSKAGNPMVTVFINTAQYFNPEMEQEDYNTEMIKYYTLSDKKKLDTFVSDILKLVNAETLSCPFDARTLKLKSPADITTLCKQMVGLMLFVNARTGKEQQWNNVITLEYAKNKKII